MKDSYGNGNERRLNGLAVVRIPVGKQRANAYLVYDEESLSGLMIDPGAEGPVLMATISDRGVRVRAILLTHGHWDHLGAAHDVASATGAKVYIHPADIGLMKASPLYGFRIDGVRITVPAETVSVDDAAILRFEGGLEAKVMAAPGHTAGGAVFRIRNSIFTGDTLLSDQKSRVDLPGGDTIALERSLRMLSEEIQDDDIVCPGHGPFWPGLEARAWIAAGLRTHE